MSSVEVTTFMFSHLLSFYIASPLQLFSHSILFPMQHFAPNVVFQLKKKTRRINKAYLNSLGFSVWIISWRGKHFQ